MNIKLFKMMFIFPHVRFFFMCLWGFLSFHTLNAQVDSEPQTRETAIQAECNPERANSCIQTACEQALRPIISTNPTAPRNVFRPELINNFDWTTDLFPVFDRALSVFFHTADNKMQSPFHQSGNRFISHFNDNESRDNSPNDGWELITKDFGGIYSSYYPEAVNNRFIASVPYLVLYNKFLGKLRVLVVRKHTDEINFHKIIVRFDGTNKSSLLDLHQHGVVPLDAKFVEGALQASAFTENLDRKWFYADFFLTYDPCTCHYNKNKIIIEIDNVIIATLKLSGTLEGTLVSIEDNKANPNDDEKSSGFSMKSINKFAQKYVKAFGAIDKLNKDAKLSIDKDDITSNENTNSAATQIEKETAKNNINLFSALWNVGQPLLKGGLKSLPYVTAALTLYDVFSAGGASDKSPTKVKVMPMALRANINLSGTIEEKNPYTSITFDTPGSIPNGTQSEYPRYNEILGVFTLLETPEVNEVAEFAYLQGIRDITGTRLTYSLRKPLKYVLNPASGLEIQDVRVALVCENIKNHGSNKIYNLGGFPIYVADTIAATEAVDPTLGSPSGFVTHEGSTFLVKPKIRVRIILNMRRKDGQGDNVLLTYTYDANNIRTTQSSTCKLCFVNTSKTELDVFCSSSTYKNGRIKPLKDTVTTTTSFKRTTLKAAINIAPNPANQEVAVHYDLKVDGIVKSYIMDLTGRVVSEVFTSEVSKGNYSLTFPTQTLSNGMYIVVFEQNGERSTHKLVISH